MPWFIPAAMALASGIANAVSSNSQVEQQRRNIRGSQLKLYENIVDENELDQLLRANQRAFNTAISSTLNSTAIRTRGFNNQPTITAAAIAPIEGQKEQSAANIRESVLGRNAQINSQIAGLELNQPASDSVGAFVSGAIPGATAGIELGKYIDGPTNLGATDTVGQNIPSVDSFNGFNPFNNSGRSNMQLKTRNPYIDYLGEDQALMNRKLNPFSMN